MYVIASKPTGSTRRRSGRVYLEIVAENRDRIFVVDGTLPVKDVTRKIISAWESRFQARFACL
jgi:thymidylate kinase